MKKIVLIVLAVILVAGIVKSCPSREASYSKKMEEGIDEKKQLSENADKVVIRWENDNRHKYTSDLVPEQYVAENAEDVLFIIKIKVSEKFEGTYTNGRKAYSYIYRVNWFDRRTGKHVLSEALQGGSPPHAISNNNDAYGSRPNEEVTKLIQENYDRFR